MHPAPQTRHLDRREKVHVHNWAVVEVAVEVEGCTPGGGVGRAVSRSPVTVLVVASHLNGDLEGLITKAASGRSRVTRGSLKVISGGSHVDHRKASNSLVGSG